MFTKSRNTEILFNMRYNIETKKIVLVWHSLFSSLTKFLDQTDEIKAKQEQNVALSHLMRSNI